MLNVTVTGTERDLWAQVTKPMQQRASNSLCKEKTKKSKEKRKREGEGGRKEERKRDENDARVPMYEILKEIKNLY